jgi:O-antigen/teichoic acid export membrane protein
MNSTNFDTTSDTISKRLAWITAANFIGFGLSFIAPFLLVRLLSQDDYGIYKELFQMVATLMNMLNLQVASSAYYFLPRLSRETEKKQTILNILLFYVLLGILVSLLFVEYPKWETLIFHDDELLPYIPLIGVTFCLWIISSNLEWIPLALGDTKLSAFYMVISQFTKSGLLIVSALVFRSVGAVVWASIIQGVLQVLLLGYYLYKRFGGFSNPFNWQLLKKQLRNSIPYGAGDIVQALQYDMHIYFVAHYFSPSIFAVYTIGCFQLPLLLLVESSVNQVLTPALLDLEAKGDRRSMVNVWIESMRKMALTAIPFVVLMFVIRQDLITTLFTENYRDAIPLFGIHILGSVLVLLLTEPVLRAFPELKFFNLKLSLLMLPLTAILLYMGIHYAGLVGAITATIILRVIIAAVTMIALFAKLQIQRVDVGRFLIMLGRPALSAALASGVASLVIDQLTGSHPIVKIMTGASIFGCIFIVLAIFTNAIEEKTRAEIMIFFRKLVQKTGIRGVKRNSNNVVLRAKSQEVTGD